MPPPPTVDADVIQNKLNVLFANQQRLLASWLPPRTEEELTKSKSQEEIEKEEEAIFAPVPATLGIGAPLPKAILDGDARRSKLSSNDQLRKRLLGKRPVPGISRSLEPEGHVLSKPVVKGGHSAGTARRLEHEDDADDEPEGRSAVGKSKRRRLRGGEAEVAASEDGHHAAMAGAALTAVERVDASKRTGNFLDEVLAEKGSKRKKKKKKRRKELEVNQSVEQA